jgi:predicted dehydrogenase
MNQKKLKIAVVGTGNVATGNYLPALAKHEDVQLCCYNRTAAKARQVAQTFNAQYLESLEDVAAWQPDAALVLTSEMARFDTAMQLVDLGLPRLFFEKPLVARNGQAHVDEQDFELGCQLMQAAQKRQCQTAMIFNYRFFEQTRTAKQIAIQRQFGQVVNFMGMVHYACWSHCIDLVHHFAGDLKQITALQGDIMRKGQGITAEDVGASMQMSNGAIGTLVGTAAMSWQHPLYELVLNFEHGRIHMRDIDGTMEILDHKQNVHETRTITRNDSRWQQYSNSFAHAVNAYLDSLRNQSMPPVPGFAGLRELQTEASLKRSAAQRRPVDVQREFSINLQYSESMN